MKLAPTYTNNNWRKRAIMPLAAMHGQCR